MILYHGEPNLFALKALIALHEARIAFESRPIGQVPLERAVPDYPAETAHRINVERDGPVLVADDGTVVTGSFFLLEYLADSHPQAGLLPDGALPRYRAQAIGQTVANMVAPFVVKLGLAAHPLPASAGAYDDIEPSERREAWAGASSVVADDAADRLRPTIARLDAMLGEAGEWFLGQFSIVDIDVFAMVRNLPALAPDLLSEAPNLRGLIERMEARPSVQAALAAATGPNPDRVFAPGPEISRWG